MIFIIVKHVTALDNPINGYVDGYSDSEDLGIFVLRPETMLFKNKGPMEASIWLWTIVNNSFSPEDNEFYDRKH